MSNLIELKYYYFYLMTKICLTAVLLIVYITSTAQGWLPVGARSMSLANSTVAVADVWSYHHNPGALAQVTQTSFGASYENRFLLKELQTQGLVCAVPLKVGVLSFGVQSYGYKTYRTNRIGAGYSLKLAEKIAAGVQLNYQGLRIDAYGSKNTVTAEFGFLAKISEKVSIGFSVLNLNKAKASLFQDDRFSTYMRLGTNYQISSKVRVLLEAEKEIQSKLRAKGGVEYELLDRFYVRAGAASNPIEVTFGFGYQFKNRLKLDMGSAWHQQLGWSPHIGLTYEIKPAVHE
jgi:hypothetical protein